MRMKAKHASLPKLKTILAHPHQEKYPTLAEEELQQLEKLFTGAISSSRLNPQAFVTSAHIRIGLESSLRAIKNSQCSCVLLSLSIKPRFLVGLIARNSVVKNETVPVYVQPKLEDFIKRVFGIKALALVLPTVDTMLAAKLSDDLIGWVEVHQRPVRAKMARIVRKLVKKPKKKDSVIKNESPSRNLQEIQVEQPTNTESSDFISFSDVMEVAKADPIEDERHLETVLIDVAERAERQTASEGLVDKPIEVKSVKEVELDNKVDLNAASSDSDDFLPNLNYEPLIVYKIRPNAQKAQKKRTKNKKPKKN